MDSLKDMDITSEEVDRFQNALKDEKFRKMFVEYAEEISNPENRKLYEEEITKMEAARGTDVQFIYPVPGFVLKTSVNGDKKAFINVCKNDRIEKASSTTTIRTNAQGKKSKGDQWSMPYSLSDGRDDLDKAGAVCRVYDVVFHPDTFIFAEKEPRLKQLMIDTSIDGIETNFKVKFDKANIKEMKKLKFKGTPVATMLRTQNGNKPKTIEDGVAALNLKYPYDDDVKNRSPIKDPKDNDKITSKSSKPNYTVPEYTIIHRGEFDMQNFTNSPDSMTSTRPKELVIKIKLPLLDSAANVDLEVHERQLVIECVKPVSYKLDITLPNPVNDDRGTAKFDKSKRCLVVTLPVIMQELPAMPSFAPATANAEPLIQELPDPVEDESNGDVHWLKNMENNTDIHDGEIVGSNEVEGGKMEEPIVVNCKEEEKNNEEEVTLVHPTFTFSQDSDFVHLVIDACGVQPASVVYQLPALQDAVSIKMMDAANPGGPVQYSLYLKFTDGCTISKDVLVDVSAENVVVALEKQPSCKGLWDMLMAGINQQSLQEKMFLTENNVKTVFDEDSNNSGVFDNIGANDVNLNVTTLDADKMHLHISLGNDAEYSLMNGAGDGRIDDGEDEKLDGTTESKINGAGDSKISGAKDDNINGAEDSKTKSENDVAILATAWQNLDLDGCNDTTSQSSTPTSPSSLKSLLSGNRRRCHKSVSFCEEVEVEMLVKKGKGKKGQAPKVRRTLSYEKIKDNSWNSFSDSEFVLNSNNIKVNILKPRETGQNRRRNRRTLKNVGDKNSDSEAVESRIQSPRQKGKTKRQKRSSKSGKRSSESLSERSETSEEETKAFDENKSERLETSDDEVILKEDNKEHQQLNNNNVEMKSGEIIAVDDDADKPLELQDHRTASAVSFSNIVIHELD
ncbi:protein kintoun-like [Anneissia japonica]|uniref:protein kintoun-like n=1 Tax=Anneissia japonica TaxID=1529436 RepID=UPI001425AF85|nr:protein kintoun-like [Anneissia japonica]